MPTTLLRNLALCGLLLPCLWALPAAGAADCTLSLNDSTVDYGRLFGQRVGEAGGGVRTPIAASGRTLTALCKNDTAIAVKLDGVDTGEGTFRLGEVADYALAITQMTLDGKPVQTGKSTAGVPAVVVNTPAQFRPGDVVMPMASGAPMTGRRLEIQLRIQAFQARQTALSHETTVQSENHFRLVTP